MASVNDGVAKLKRGKHDGSSGDFSNHIINGTPKLCTYYRAVALSSILGKLLDNILLAKCRRAFQTSDLQYGF